MPKYLYGHRYGRIVSKLIQTIVSTTKSKKGISFIEIVVAALLVALVVVAMGGALTQSSVFSRRIDTIYTATNLAQRHMDTLKQLEYNELPGAAEINVRIDDEGNVSAGGTYRRTTRVRARFRGNPYLTRVEVRIQRSKIGLDGAILRSFEDPISIVSLFSNME